jgi:hypothetical protein
MGPCLFLSLALQLPITGELASSLLVNCSSEKISKIGS